MSSQGGALSSRQMCCTARTGRNAKDGDATGGTHAKCFIASLSICPGRRLYRTSMSSSGFRVEVQPQCFKVPRHTTRLHPSVCLLPMMLLDSKPSGVAYGLSVEMRLVVWCFEVGTSRLRLTAELQKRAGVVESAYRPGASPFQHRIAKSAPHRGRDAGTDSRLHVSFRGCQQALCSARWGEKDNQPS